MRIILPGVFPLGILGPENYAYVYFHLRAVITTDLSQSWSAGVTYTH